MDSLVLDCTRVHISFQMSVFHRLAQAIFMASDSFDFDYTYRNKYSHMDFAEFK